jgi:hypothetical protein
MSWWTLEQALIWAMWRDETRAGRAKDGDVRPALQARVRDTPQLSDREYDEAVGWLLEHGTIHLVPLSTDEPHRGWEERSGIHVASGCRVSVKGWREGTNEPLCTDGTLYWQQPSEQPRLGLKEAMAELLGALREGRVEASAEPPGAPGDTVDVPPEKWRHAELRLSRDSRVGGHMGPQGYLGGGGATRLRFEISEIKRLWSAVQEPRPVSGAAAGKWYRDDAVDRAARAMLAREARGRPVTNDDIAATLDDLANKLDDGGVVDKTVRRWVPRVRTRMDQLRPPQH